MENFKKVLKTRRLALQIYCGVIAVLIVCLNLFTPGTEDFQMGFTLGAALGTEILAVILIGKYNAAIKSEEKLKQLYICENDEQCKFIQAQIGSLGLNIVIALLALVTIVSGFFNQIAFFSLLGALLCCAIVKGTLKVYFKNKI
jgi:hypothetical protein